MLPFELRIGDIDQAQQLIALQWPTRIITLLGPDLPPKPNISSTGDHHLRVEMDDITTQMPGWIAPNAGHIKKILEFSKDFKCNDRVLIHCRGGISRSTSTSVGVLVQHGMAPDAALHAVQSLRPVADPNELIIHLMDHALCQCMNLIDAYQAWADRHPQTLINRMPRAYRDEIDSNARELYKLWQHWSHARKGAEWRS